MDWKDVAKACWEEADGLNNFNYYIGSDNTCYMQFDIDGDWKWAHTRFKWWLRDYCEENNIDYEIVNRMTIDDYDGDSYRAIYEVVMKMKSKGDR